jgi:predicted ferric reductase
MGRAGWLEPIFGLDRLAIFHRRNGVATLSLILLHSSSIIVTHAILSGHDVVSGSLIVLGLPFVWMAALAELLFIMTVGASIIIVRKHLKFETWYAVHIFNYAAIALVPFHQLTNGDDFLTNPTFVYYWLSLYAFAALNIIVWRVGRPLWRLWRHQFVIEKIVSETATATSVYITGKHMEKFKAKGGQFVLVRFFDKRVAWQEHPFSLSMLPDGQRIRLTIRQLGDFTNLVPTFKPGTRVWVSGPYGAFTHELARTDKIAYIAGGIGITPIRSMIEEKAKSARATDAILLYGNRSEADTALLAELKPLGRELRMPIFNVLSDQPKYKGEKGFIDKNKIARLIPDAAQRDIFLCGPPPMMAGVKKSLKELGVPDAQVHYERFALHKD